MTTEKATYEADRLLDHDFDGIQEYDNRLPNWWLWILWGSIVFSVGYWLVFHTYGVFQLPVAAYESHMEEAGGAVADMESRGVTEEGLVAMSVDPTQFAAGQELWTQYCVVCHKPDGSGLVGPNLTDAYWIHGGDVAAIHDIVVRGVPEKGMAAWGRQLGPERVDAVVAFVLTLRGQDLPGKEPQGELYEPAAMTPEAADAVGEEAPAEAETAMTEAVDS